MRYLFLILPLILMITWGVNIYKLCFTDFEAPYKTEIVRGIGVAIAPLTVITAFMDIGEENDAN